jgi:predicted TIM-barrel fold metal-dependent hydrolase
MDRRSFLTASIALTAAASLPGRARGAPLAPFKLYDTHTHLYSSDLEKYPYRLDIAAANKTRTLAKPMTPEVLLKMFDEAGVEMGCGVQYNTTYYTDNSFLIDSSEKYPKRITPVVILAPQDPATPCTLKAMAHGEHIVGVRFSGAPDAEGNFAFLTGGADRAWAAANELGLVIVLMPVRSVQPQALPWAMKKIGEFAAKYPNVNIVIDHIGFPEIRKDATFGFSPDHLALSQHKNVHYKFTTFLIEQLDAGKVSTREFLNYAVGHFGIDHFVWGSDIGNTSGQYPELVKMGFEAAQDLTLAQKKALFYSNAKALFVPGGRGMARP